MSEHAAECRWERTTSAECEYRATHHYCPHAEHACDCTTVRQRAEKRIEAATAEALSRVSAERDALVLKLSTVSKLLDDWAEAERQGLGVPILAGIGQLREALK